MTFLRQSSWQRIALLLALGAGAVARADSQEPLVIDDAAPENSVPNAQDAMNDPMRMNDIVMELAARAERAEGAGQATQAARYYRALAKAVPERATGFARACRAHEAAGEAERAIEMCRLALGKPGVTLDDSARFVRLLVQRGAPLTPAEITDLDALVDHIAQELAGDPSARLVAADLRCQIAAKLEDGARLTACSSVIMQEAPRDPRAFMYGALAALKKGEWQEVESLLARARADGIPSEAIRLVEQRMANLRATTHASSLQGSVVWFLVLGCAALAVLISWLSHRRTLRASA